MTQAIYHSDTQPSYEKKLKYFSAKLVYNFKLFCINKTGYNDYKKTGFNIYKFNIYQI